MLSLRIRAKVRHLKDRANIAKASRDDELRRETQTKINLLTSKYAKLSKSANLPTKMERLGVRGFRVVKETKELKYIEKKADLIYNKNKSLEERVKIYLDNKDVVDLLEKYNYNFVDKISDKEIIVSTGEKSISNVRQHFLDNLGNKVDRKNITVEVAKSYMDTAKIIVFQKDRETFKYISDNGYAVLNFDRELVTAVPQKWRKKYDKYL